MGYLLGFFSLIIPHQLSYMIEMFLRGLATSRNKHRFKTFGDETWISPHLQLINPSFISIGNHSSILSHGILETSSAFHQCPSLTIGNHVFIGEYCHITCANRISIGNGVLTGRFVLITDNAHGGSTYSDMKTHPLCRPLISKGEVVIHDHVWIGDKVTILPGVHIGEGAIIGAGSVVTKDIPAFSVAVGNPAQVLKTIHQ